MAINICGLLSMWRSFIKPIYYTAEEYHWHPLLAQLQLLG